MDLVIRVIVAGVLLACVLLLLVMRVLWRVEEPDFCYIISAAAAVGAIACGVINIKYPTVWIFLPMYFLLVIALGEYTHGNALEEHRGGGGTSS